MANGTLRIRFGDSMELAADMVGYGVPDGAAWEVLIKDAADGGTTLLDISSYTTWTEDAGNPGNGILDIAVPYAEMAAHVSAGNAWMTLAFVSGTERTTLGDRPVKLVVEEA